ncbi:AraC family transcriptional regulator [Flavobacterium sp.]|uniref:helix-turn-helix domain-containing protein n=1 Tax=Flavobacterium sp. TaxID=239 RepID=UPI0026227D42|nr:AraC family transcriptional regulator [Flavobacterium sp.]
MSKHFLEIKSISQLHELLGYEKPKHPLVTIIDYSKLKLNKEHFDIKILTNFYIISLKDPAPKSVQYGRHYYDFAEGTLMFISPSQVFSISEFDKHEKTSYQGWGVYFHTDLIANSSLYDKMQDFTFFSYAVSEALHVSEDEKQTLNNLVDAIKKEYQSGIDNYSKDVIITGIEQLLNYSKRFYSRQFITRQKQNSDVVTKFEKLLKQYFKIDKLEEEGIPNVDYFSSNLNLSSSYLSDLLKKETGKTIKDYIQFEILELAKHRLLNSNQTVNEIAYSLGFDYPQYFNRLFKSKIGMTPVEYRLLN